LALLKNIDNPCIDDCNRFLRDKSILVVWFNALEKKGEFNYTFRGDEERAATLKHNFPNLDISDSLFRYRSKKAIRSNYKSYFENEIIALKSKQF
jgi:hypothetical protein